MRFCALSLLLLLINHTANAHEPLVVPPGQGSKVAVPFHPATLLLSQTQSTGGIAVYEFIVPPRSGGAPPHVHTHEDEYAYVLDGTLTFMLGENTVEAQAGTLAALTRGHLHAFWNAGEKPATALFFVSEGGFEKFFDAVAVSLRERPPASPDEANTRVGKIAAEHDIHIHPDKIPAGVMPLYAPK